MNFLDDMSPSHRQRLVEASSVRVVLPGEYLVRRGEAGGDLFLVLDGQMQVVDTRTRPATIIAVMGPGDTIGEIAYIDHAPRSADVRAAVESTVRHWSREDVHAMIAAEPELGTSFYEALCKVAVRRLRNLTRNAVSGAMGRAPQATVPPGARLAEHDAMEVAHRAKAVLREVELALRADPSDQEAVGQLHALLDSLQEDARRLRETHTEPDARALIATTWRTELHPWLVRSAFAERSVRRPRGVAASPEILSHVYVGTPTGDGLLGELIDQWLLARPTLTALREVRRALVDSAAAATPSRRGRRVLVLNAGTGSVVDGLVHALAGEPTTLTVADPSRDALAFLDRAELPPRVSVSGIREDLPQLAAGRMRNALPPQDVIVVHDLLPYFPDRLAVSLLRAMATQLVPGGAIVASGLGPSEDQPLLDLLLRWPTIRRAEDGCHRVAEAAAVDIDLRTVGGGPGVVLVARPRVPALAPGGDAH
jgi:CRP-like cAMP-binding protein